MKFTTNKTITGISESMVVVKASDPKSRAVVTKVTPHPKGYHVWLKFKSGKPWKTSLTHIKKYYRLT